MSKSAETLWEIEPHTIAKHEILKRYLDAWFPILATYNQRIIYLDGFCGPGRYKGGEEGSPVIAIKKALNHVGRLNGKNITFIFIDENKDRIDHLQQELDSMTIPENFSVLPVVSQFENTVSQILSDLKSQNLNLAPTFAFLDPFGFKGLPYSLVKELLSNPKTEVFINIMAGFIQRFINHPDATTRQYIVDLFGTPQVLQIISQGGDRLVALRQLYQTQLQACAKYVRYFEMQDECGRVIYYLFFAGNNRLGYVRIKESFWNVDPDSGFHFSDATNPAQMILFSVDPSQDLVKILKQKFAGQRIVVSKILDFVEEETSYVAKHMRKSLTFMEAENSIKVDVLKPDGSKRRKNSFTEEVVVTFSL